MEEHVEKVKESVSYTIQEILKYEIFSIGKYSLSVYEVLGAVVAIFLGWFVSRMTKRFIYRSDKIDVARKFAFSRIIHYLVVIITFVFVMKALGVDMSPLLVGSGALLVGVGLGLQNLVLDFISGVIILIDRTIKVGDVIDVDGTIGQVLEIKMRTTTILTRDNKNIIFPNSSLTSDRLINFTHGDDMVRFEVTVGVHYDTNINVAEKLMIEAATEHSDVMKKREPKVFLENFGDSSLDLKLMYFSKNLFRAPLVKSKIRRSILDKFRANGINIPFPIRTLDFPKGLFENQTINIQKKD